MRLMKIEKSIVPLLMATMVLLTSGSNVHVLFGHNFSSDESASFLALVSTIKAEAQLVQQNIASNNMSLASDHANKALALITVNVTKEIAERNERLSDDLNTDLASLKASTESTSGNNTASSTDTGILVDVTDMSMMTMGGDNNNTGGTGGNDTTSMHSMSTMNMGGDDNMSMEDMSNSDGKLVNITDYQTAQALAMKVQELFDSQITTKSLSEGSESVDQSINNTSTALKELVTSIDGKSSPMDIMTIVHTKIHPNLLTAFGLQLENN